MLEVTYRAVNGPILEDTAAPELGTLGGCGNAVLDDTL